MTLPEATLAFQVRYYHWATSEWEREINEGFPNLRSFKGGPPSSTYRFMRLFGKDEQMTIARGLLERAHPDAIDALGETCSPEEQKLRRKRDAYLVPSPIEEEIAARRNAGEKVKFASKRKLQTATMRKFQNAFGERCTNSNYDDLCDPSSLFETKCYDGWNISTQFWFGRRESLIDYNQSIVSELTFHQKGETGDYTGSLLLKQGISLCGWLGIGPAQWPHIKSEEVDQTCDTVIKYCQYFSEFAPKLLKGLEVDNLTID
jgi:hypothetical protein